MATTVRYLGPGTYTDHGRSFKARPDTEHDLPDEQAEEYLSHELFGDRWERVGEDADILEAAEEDAETADDDATPEAEGDDLQSLTGVGKSTAENLDAKGFGSFDAIREASVADLAGVQNVSESDAESLKEQLDKDEE